MFNANSPYIMLTLVNSIGVIVTLFGYVDLSTSFTHDLSQLGLTDTPEFIPFGVTTLQLRGNALTDFPDLRNHDNVSALATMKLGSNLIWSIDPERIEALESLEMLILTSNRLRGFPELTNPPPLWYLDLEGNPLTRMPRFGAMGLTIQSLFMSATGLSQLTVEDLAQFSVLKLIKLYYNDLSVYPDFSPVAGSINTVISGFNPYRNVGLASLVALGRSEVTILDIMDSELQVLPNLCHVPGIDYIHWNGASHSPLRCDCHARWLKLAVQDGLYSYGQFYQPQCASPLHLAGHWLGDVAIEELVCEDMSRAFETTRIDPGSFRCSIPPVLETRVVSGMTECAQKCASIDGCHFYRLTISPNGGTVCGITNILLNSTGGSINSSTEKWFTLD